MSPDKCLFWDALTNIQLNAMGCVRNNVAYDTLIESFMLAFVKSPRDLLDDLGPSR